MLISKKNLIKHVFLYLLWLLLSDEWTELSPLNNARDGLVLNNVEGTIMAIGGQYRGAPVEVIEKWNGDRYKLKIKKKLDKINYLRKKDKILGKKWQKRGKHLLIAV